jgi:hypothetical protein
MDTINPADAASHLTVATDMGAAIFLPSITPLVWLTDHAESPTIKHRRKKP